MITIGRMTAPGRRTPTLYHWAGDAEAFERLTELFYRKVHEDPLLAPVFAHVGPDHAHHVAIWLAEVFGGPSRYTEELSGYAAMMRHHLGLHLTEEKRRRWAQLLAETADEAGLPNDPEFRSAFVAYIEWGSRIGMANSQPGAAPPQEAPVPRWGWGEAPPET
jgi:hemoglobin